jgi:hypothetical protein
MRLWPCFEVWFDDVLRIAHSWRLSRSEVESAPFDWYYWCWQKRWHPSDALMTAMQDVDMMNPDGYFDL